MFERLREKAGFIGERRDFKKYDQIDLNTIWFWFGEVS